MRRNFMELENKPEEIQEEENKEENKEEKTEEKPDKMTEMMGKVVEAIQKSDEKTEKTFNLLKRQVDGASFKIRELSEKKPEEKPAEEFNYEEEQKPEEAMKGLLKEQNDERSSYYIKVAREKLNKLIKEKKINVDISDDYAWNDFINGQTGADDPKDRPFYSHRQDPISKCYIDAENPFKDMLEHFYTRYPEHKSGEEKPSEETEEFTLDSTPSSDSKEREEKSFTLTSVQKDAAKKLGLSEKEYWEINRGNTPGFNLQGRQKEDNG